MPEPRSVDSRGNLNFSNESPAKAQIHDIYFAKMWRYAHGNEAGALRKCVGKRSPAIVIQNLRVALLGPLRVCTVIL